MTMQVNMQLRDLYQAFDVRPELQTFVLDPLLASFFETSTNTHLKLDVLRLDKVHPFISGNKWYKLKHHLLGAEACGKRQVLSFGGAYSNHLHALAFAGQHFGFGTVGLVRGKDPGKDALSPTLQDCLKWGMQLKWLGWQDYRRFAMGEHNTSVQAAYPDAHIIPEGGDGVAGLQGVRELLERFLDELDESYDMLVSPVGSGTTLAGMYAAAAKGQRVIGVSALKNCSDLEARVSANIHWLNEEDIEIWHDYHLGGFAKMTPLLQRFVSEVHQHTGLLLDPVYTGKTMYAILHKFAHYKLGPSPRILMLHTGGLQGWRGYASSSPVDL